MKINGKNGVNGAINMRVRGGGGGRIKKGTPRWLVSSSKFYMGFSIHN